MRSAVSLAIKPVRRIPLTPSPAGFLQRQAGAPALVQDVLRSPGRPLDPATRTDMQSRFGHDFSRVRIHLPAALVVNRVQHSTAGPILQRHSAPESEHSSLGEEGGTLTEEEVRQLSEALCIGITPGVGPVRCTFTDRQERRVSLTKRWAWDLASRAALALSSGDRYIVMLAERIFHISRPDVRAMVQTLDQIRDALWNTPVECGTCADEVCNTGRRTAAAYVPDDFSSIVICPFFFTLSLGQMKRTFLHEAGHVVRIDDRPDYEHPPYCTEVDRVECEDPCSGISDLLHNVDAWARFIECAAYSY